MGTFFFPCLPSNGGSPWYPSNHIWTPGCCSFCYLYHRCCCPSQGTGIAASISGPLPWTFLALRTQDNVTNTHVLKAALTSMLNSLLCNHICGISNLNLNCWAGVLWHPSCDSPSLLPHTQLPDTTTPSLSSSFIVVIAFLAISLKIFLFWEIKSVQPAWTL